MFMLTEFLFMAAGRGGGHKLVKANFMLLDKASSYFLQIIYQAGDRNTFESGSCPFEVLQTAAQLSAVICSIHKPNRRNIR